LVPVQTGFEKFHCSKALCEFPLSSYFWSFVMSYIQLLSVQSFDQSLLIFTTAICTWFQYLCGFCLSSSFSRSSWSSQSCLFLRSSKAHFSSEQ
jgi:uncharacterized membrane protein